MDAGLFLVSPGEESTTMKNCWRPAIEHLIYGDGRGHILFRYTRKNTWSWRAPRWVHAVVGWGLIMPCLLIINVAVFALRARWLHAYWETGDGAFSEYAPLRSDYRRRRFPMLSFAGEVRDSGKRLVDHITAHGDGE